MRYLFTVLVSLALVSTSQAGTISLNAGILVNYVGKGFWGSQGPISATSTTPWPGFVNEQVIELFSDQAVLESGLMMYRCNPSVQGGCGPGDSDVHRFVHAGPIDPSLFPDLFLPSPPPNVDSAGGHVFMSDKIVAFNPTKYRRIWNFKGNVNFLHPTRHDALPVPGEVLPAEEFEFPSFTVPLFPPGFVVTLHLADEDTIDQMLSGLPGSFGPPLAHRTFLPCVIIRINGDGTINSMACKVNP